MVNVYIKGVDAEAYKKAKLLAVKKDKNIGEVISEAVELLNSKLSSDDRVEKPLSVLRSVKITAKQSASELCQEAEGEFW